MSYLWIKSLHVVSIISWMAGLLYLYRLFVYHAMESEAVVRSRLEVMERRLLRGIATPAAVASVFSGAALLWVMPAYLQQPWMHAKLALVFGLLASHGLAIRYRRQLQRDPHATSHQVFRWLNELPTLLMIGIVILIIVRPWGR